MLDIKILRENPQEAENKLLTKEPDAKLNGVMVLDTQIREMKGQVEELKSKRNELSKAIGVKKRQGQDVTSIMEEVSSFGDQIAKLDPKLSELEAKFKDELARLPNLPMEGIKVSPDPKDNVIIKEKGNRPNFSFTPKNHLELNERLELLDFPRGAKITGTGWPVYKGMGARLEWALINYMLDIQRKNGFEQYIPPLLVRPEILFGSSQLPKFADQQYRITDKDFDFYLIPTAEVALNGLHFDEIIDEDELPLKYTAYTPCFRREAGAAGKNERGLIRVHQFNKVEMFCFTKPEDSEVVFGQMMASAEEVLEGLELHYRNALLVTGDMSFAAAKTVDIEVWLPGQDRYYEVSSVSNCTDYQARRSNIRYRGKNKKPEFVHTLNGSGLATARLMVALLENNQQEDGSVLLPKALHPYLGGQDRLVPQDR